MTTINVTDDWPIKSYRQDIWGWAVGAPFGDGRIGWYQQAFDARYFCAPALTIFRLLQAAEFFLRSIGEKKLDGSDLCGEERYRAATLGGYGCNLYCISEGYAYRSSREDSAYDYHCGWIDVDGWDLTDAPWQSRQLES